MVHLFVDESRPCPPGWKVARTITEAIRILATEKIGYVSLDYDIDLNFKVEIPSRRGTKEIEVEVKSEETFESVARYIALMPEHDRPVVQYHTANPDGERIMRSIVDDGD